MPLDEWLPASLISPVVDETGNYGKINQDEPEFDVPISLYRWLSSFRSNRWFLFFVFKGIYTEGERYPMDQIKIGKFITACRKQENLTQAQLAEKPGLTDRAISKWETCNAMPDPNIMQALCETLDISVDELLSGEKIDREQKNETFNELMVQMAEHEARYRKRLLYSACMIIATSLIALVCLVTLISLLIPECGFQTFLIAVSLVLFAIPCVIALKFEVETGYYAYKNCQHMFVPNCKEAVPAMYTPNRRLLKCPQCGKWTWCKKAIKQ